MKKLGAGIVLIDERDGYVMYYLHEDYPSIRTLIVNDEGELQQMSFESWDFFNGYNRIFTLNKKKNILGVEDDDFEKLLKVFPYVREEIGREKVSVVMSPKILLDFLERGKYPSMEFSRIKDVFRFFLPNAELEIEEKVECGVTYYTTSLEGRTFVVIPEVEAGRHKGAVGDLLEQIRQDIAFVSKSLEEKVFLERLKEAVKKDYEKKDDKDDLDNLIDSEA